MAEPDRPVLAAISGAHAYARNPDGALVVGPAAHADVVRALAAGPPRAKSTPRTCHGRVAADAKWLLVDVAPVERIALSGAPIYHEKYTNLDLVWDLAVDQVVDHVGELTCDSCGRLIGYWTDDETAPSDGWRQLVFVADAETFGAIVPFCAVTTGGG